ncbi:nitroreductase family protein [Chloroflexota bacterium]
MTAWEKGVTMDYEALLKLLENRRSIRRFKPDPVPDEYVEKIIDAARWAPSGFNQQPWEFVVVRQPELRAQIAGFCREMFSLNVQMEAGREPARGKDAGRLPQEGPGDFTTAPVYILLFGDTRTNEGLPTGVKYDPHGLQMTFEGSLTGAFLYMHLAATALGLASQWVSSVHTPYVHFRVKKLLGIPEPLVVYDMMALGYPALEPRPKLLRDREKMVHYDASGPEDFRTDAEVRDFISKSRAWNIATESRKPEK